jgi:hypothetical protein
MKINLKLADGTAVVLVPGDTSHLLVAGRTVQAHELVNGVRPYISEDRSKFWEQIRAWNYLVGDAESRAQGNMK